MAKEKRFPVFAQGEVSSEFYNAFCDSGSDSISCTCCGRVHFCSSDFGGDDPEELNYLLAKAKEDPEKYLDHDNRPYWFFWGDKQVVFGCPCRFDVALENIIWAWHHDICEYFVARARKEHRLAEDSLASACQAAKAIEELNQ